MWAEWYRHLAEAGIQPNEQMPRDVWTWTVDPRLEVADLSSAERGGALLVRLGCCGPRGVAVGRSAHASPELVREVVAATFTRLPRRRA